MLLPTCSRSRPPTPSNGPAAERVNVPGTLLVRADAGRLIGAGHVMRCLALAEEWRSRGGRVVLASTALHPRIASRWKALRCMVVEHPDGSGSVGDSLALAELARSVNADWVVIDGYQFSVSYQRRLQDPVRSVLVVDDNGEAGECECDLVLNQNPHASPDLYRCRSARTHLLLGLRYALLRREFGCRTPRLAATPTARRVLVLTGGGDDGGLLGDVIQWLGLAAREQLNVRAVVGPLGRVTKPVALGSNLRVSVVRGTDQLAAEMALADTALSAAGSVCWELAYLRVPALIVAIADNQRASAAWLAGHGAFLVLDREALTAAPHAARPRSETLCHVETLLYDEAARRDLSVRAGSLVDGYGAQRVVDVMVAGTTAR